MPSTPDKGAVVTGVAQGIGRAIAERLVADGYGVVGVDTNQDGLFEVALALGESFVPFRGNVARHDDCGRAIHRCVDEFQILSVVAAHAGIAEPQPLLDLDDRLWSRHMSINVDGAMYCTVEAGRAMQRQDQPGSIVITTSINAFHVEETHGPYNTTKGALWTFIRTAALEFAQYGIRVNGVAPGVIDTPLCLPRGSQRADRTAVSQVDSALSFWAPRGSRERSRLAGFGTGLVRDRPHHRYRWGPVARDSGRPGRLSLRPICLEIDGRGDRYLTVYHDLQPSVWLSARCTNDNTKAARSPRCRRLFN